MMDAPIRCPSSNVRQHDFMKIQKYILINTILFSTIECFSLSLVQKDILALCNLSQMKDGQVESCPSD